MTVRFKGKVFIEGILEVVTGLHIGGAKSALDIGGLDLGVIKTAKGQVPFIPGSSFKGKLRSIMAREVGSVATTRKGVGLGELCDEDFPYILDIFGYSGDQNLVSEEDEEGEILELPTSRTPTRLLVPDAYLMVEAFQEHFSQDRDHLASAYTEEKWENTVDRRTGTALNPRQIERVPAGARFSFRLIYNVFDDQEVFTNGEYSEKAKYKCDYHLEQLRKALRILEDDYLGGNGSRGYGRISFPNVTLRIKTLQDYEQGTKGSVLSTPYWDSGDALNIYETHFQQ